MRFGIRDKSSGQPDNNPVNQVNPSSGVPSGGTYFQNGNGYDASRQTPTGVNGGPGNYAGYGGGYGQNPAAGFGNPRGQTGGYPGYGTQNQYQANPGYGTPNQYQANPGYGTQNQYQANPGYGTPNQYQSNPGYGTQNQYQPGSGYGTQSQYQPNQGYGTQNQYQPGPGYGSQNQYPPNPGYGTQSQYQPGTGYGTPNPANSAYGTPGYPGQGTGATGYSNRGNAPQGYPNPGYGNAAPAGNPSYTGQQAPNPGMPGSAFGGYPRASAPAPGERTGATGQIPLNGGGYVPPPQGKKKPFVFKGWMLYLLGGALVGILAAGLITGQPAVLGVFLALALASVILFWAVPLIDTGKRMSYTLIFAVLSVAAVIGLIRFAPAGGNDPANTGSDTGSAVSRPRENGSQALTEEGYGVTVVDPITGEVLNTVASAAATDTPAPAQPDTGASDRAVQFFQFWYGNMNDQMLDLCSPTWKNSVDNPKAALFGLLANRKPLDYVVENVSGTPDDTSRTVTVTSTIDRGNGKDPSKYRLSVLMVREGDSWYVDPQSLKTYEKTETPDPNVTNTPAPTEAPQYTNSTVLYYNPEGGSKYHLDQNCKSTHEKWLPLKGHFTYGEINDEAYAKLERCNVCGAPLRPTN